MRVDGLLDCLAQVLPEVETVRDLHRVRSALPGAFAIAAGAVPADHLDSSNTGLGSLSMMKFGRKSPKPTEIRKIFLISEIWG